MLKEPRSKERLNERILVLLAVAVALLIAALAVFWHPEKQPPLRPAALPAGGDFTLQSAAGPVALSDYQGRLVLLYFGYTFCPDICPTTLITVSDSLSRLTAEERGKVAVLFVSVDPERDTPEHLKTYLAFFDAGAVGLTGSPQEIAEIAKRYGVFYSKQPADGSGGAYSMDHSADTFLVGPDGRVRARIAHGTPPEDVAAILRQYLNP